MSPGESATLTFTVKGLKKGDWSDLDIFFRGAGDIIGATKLDEEILAEMLREEEAGIEDAAEEIEPVDETNEDDTETAAEIDADPVETVSNPGDIMSWNSGGDEI